MKIDVSELTTDPDLGAAGFVRHRTSFTMGNEGRATPSYADTPMVGVVQPAKLSDAQFLPEGVRLSDVSAFITSAEVRTGDGVTTVPDILQYKGANYKVLHLQDFGDQGMYRALAQRLPLEVSGGG